MSKTRNFTSEDLLDRKDELDTISKFIKIIPGPYVIAIEGPWGVGKTYFSKLLVDKINNDIQSVYINAWERDFIDDPILSILRGLINQFERNNIPVEKIKEKSKKYLKTAYPYLIDSLTGGVVSKDLIDDLTDNYFDQHDSREQLLEDVIILLKKLVTGLNNQKLVIIIDELDRCRPNYAIEFIERIKHLFSIEGVIFLLSINRAQLEKSIRKIYGNEIDSENYLHRFIDYEYQLTLKLNNNYILGKLDKLGLVERIGKDRANNISSLIGFLSKMINSTPRDINQIIAHYSLILKSSNYNLNNEVDSFYLTLLFISQSYKGIFKDIIKYDVDSLKIFNQLFGNNIDKADLNVYKISDLILPFISLDNQKTLLHELEGFEQDDHTSTPEKKRNFKVLLEHINNKKNFYQNREFKELIKTFRYRLHKY